MENDYIVKLNGYYIYGKITTRNKHGILTNIQFENDLDISEINASRFSIDEIRWILINHYPWESLCIYNVGGTNERRIKL